MKKKMQKKLGMAAVCLTMCLTLLPVGVMAEEDAPPLPDESFQQHLFVEEFAHIFSAESKGGLYLPDVTAAMSKASYWTEKVQEPDALLADAEKIAKINEEILNAPGTSMNDLKTWPATYNGVRQNELNQTSSLADSKTFFGWGANKDKEGNVYPTWEEALEHIYQPIIDNTQDPAAAEEMSVLYGICTNRTCLLVLPTDNPLYDSDDPDIGNLWQSAVRVNEPLILKSKTADGAYYLAITSNSSGWVPAADVAVCADQEEWLAAWDIPAEKTLVVYDNKIYTEDSISAPETAKRMLSMGTCLELADLEDYEKQPVINRWAYNNHVVWLPVRNEDGTYKKVLALIGENRKVNEGFLPLTVSNIVNVMLNQLGDTYGWGGMLETNDCSGYVRDVYKCFGLELARNTTGQPAMPVGKVDLSSMTDEEKAECIRALPPGTALYMKGHAMMYLGEENGKLYVISSVLNFCLEPESPVLNVRGALINTLDVRRGKGYGYSTWLQNLKTAVVPFYAAEDQLPIYESGVKLEKTKYTYTGSALTPAVTVHGFYKDQALTEGADYTVAYENNKNAGEAAVTVTGMGRYAGKISKSFTISKAAQTLKAAGKTVSLKEKDLKKAKQTIKRSKAIQISSAKGTLSYKKTSGSSKITINQKTGVITVAKGVKAGTYKIKVKVNAAGNKNYKAGSKTATVTIKVKK